MVIVHEMCRQREQEAKDRAAELKSMKEVKPVHLHLQSPTVLFCIGYRHLPLPCQQRLPNVLGGVK